MFMSAIDAIHFLDAMPLLAWLEGLGPGVGFLNAQWENFTGLSREHASIETLKSVIHPQDLGAFESTRSHLLNSEGPSDCRCRLRHREGHYVWHLIRFSSFESQQTDRQSPSDTPRSLWIATATDIDALVRHSETISESERHLRLIVDAAPTSLVYVDRHERYVSSNLYYEKSHGRKNDHIVGKPLREVIGSAGYDRLRPYIRSVLSGQAVSFETRVEKDDGSAITAAVKYVPDLDDNGEVRGFVATSEDVSAQKEAELRLKRSQHTLELALESAHMGTWDIDLKSGRIHCSKPMLGLWGIDPASFSGERGILQSKVHPADVAGMNFAINSAIASGLLYEIEFRVLPSPGTERWVVSRGRCVYDPVSNEPISFAGVVFDITETKQVHRELKESKEVAEKASLAKSQFLANMSHEIRTPIGVIVGFIEMLRHKQHSPEDERAFMEIIERNSQSLLRLIDDILDLSKVEAGKIILEKSRFSLPMFLTDFTSLMSFKASEKGIDFSLESQGKLPEMISTDPLRLRQILANLVGNALKFTERGEVSVLVRFKTPYLIAEVTDSGPGIATDKIPHLFHSFGQVDPSLTRRHGGSGLGLILSKRLAEALGGDVALQRSQIGQGSTFVAKIKLDTSDVYEWVDYGQKNLLPTKPAAAAMDTHNHLRDLRVLLVEDSPDNRVLVATYLKRTGIQLTMAEDGVEGFARALKDLPDLILLDIQMPKMDGHTLARRLREAGYSRPIIALTAHAMREERERCYQSGCTDYLTKPIDRERLIETLTAYRNKTSREGKTAIARSLD